LSLFVPLIKGNKTRTNSQVGRVGLSVRASPKQHRASLHAPRFREARWLPASGVRVNSSRSASRVDTAAPSPAATLHASRAAPRQEQRRAPRAAPKHGAKRPRGLRRSKSGMRLRSIFPAAKKRASRKNALRSRPGLTPRRQRVGRDRPGSAGRICRWRGAALVAPRGAAAKARPWAAGLAVRSALMARPVAAVLAGHPRWASRLSLRSAIARAPERGQAAGANPNPRGRQQNKLRPRRAQKKGRRHFRGNGPSQPIRSRPESCRPTASQFGRTGVVPAGRRIRQLP
jgi:hypothetical protein